MSRFEFASLSDIGKRRSGNEDAVYLDEGLGLFVVSDGMGGHNAGEVASSLLVNAVRDYMRRFRPDATELEDSPEELDDSDPALSKEANRLVASIHLANRVVYDRAMQELACHGMGATVSAVYVQDRAIIAANVGDSPIYLVRDGVIRPLYTQHTVKAEQEALDPTGNMKLAETFGHMLTRAVGTRFFVEVDVSEITAHRNDTLVLCSDGLSDKASEDEILEIVSSQRPARACRQLVDLALDRGGDDNITVVVVRLKRQAASSAVLLQQLSEKFFRGE